MADTSTLKHKGNSENTVTIREAEPVDIEQVAALDSHITGVAKPDYYRKAYTRYGTRPDRYFLVAERDGKILGFIIGETRAWEFGSPPCGWIFAIGVNAATREGGIGSRLFAAIAARMKKSGVATVRTMLARDDALNMAFFRSQGMRGGSFIELEMPLAEVAPHDSPGFTERER